MVTPIFHGGQGGREELDGNDVLSFPSNCKVTPVEIYRDQSSDITIGRELGKPGQAPADPSANQGTTP